ncbi:MAG: alpha-amylase, partial [Chloroflexi bacterium]|nr:alpha-amylase [Chloroflexota bacterium]
MEKSIYLGLAIHSHQPLGNFPFVFAEAYQNAYLPFLEILERHPRIKISLHYSGPLRDWIAAEHPDFIKRLASLVARGQVEIMTAGYYEPILVSIPEADRQGQIRKLSQTIQADFGYQPVGAWLTERVWEPSLAKNLAQAGVEYTVVDDHHFRGAGIEGEIQGYYITEDEGYALKVFASSQHLRYTLPWHEVEEAIGWLKDQAVSGPPRIAVMGDDGEKFGLWPGTQKLVWEDEWLERFFQKLEESEPLIQTITLAEYARTKPAAGRIYLPTASYIEMTEWALPPETA